MKRQKNRTRYRPTLYPTLFFWVFGTFFSGVLFSDGFESARKHPILRDHFLRHHIQMMSSMDAYGNMRYRGNVRSLEQEVDRLVDQYMARLTQKLGALKIHFNTVLRSREEMLSETYNDESRREAEARWKDSLKAMADEAEDLRKTLSNVLRGLDNKSDFKPQIDADSTNPGFQKEIRYIQEQIVKAEQRIRDYFFAPTHTVHLQDLQGQNMMIYLYRVEKTSKELSEHIPPNRW